ncbi:TetR/AcrR family transcriptional regulator [Streptomyces huiliensis]|uniref:TetR/AcrR family transcriptional regulator n=1 Tax=Streptomyces huiliensis TaxID=2876027 RepID=UPI001CC1354F|nr:TetR family transcriptional regulator [Streptomyces huiliensis]MBZ4318519.1 TetR family transcriptional regulator [Streptomyces huiliensis]
MTAHPVRSRSRTAAGLPPITAEKVITAALDLTREHGLEGWSIRQLSGALGVYPGVIYHHVGDREAVVEMVTDRVVAGMPLPDGDLPWRAWFQAFLVEGRLVLREHPGTARRLVRLGPTVPAALPAIDRGVRVLLRAGFGQDATLVYRYLLNSAFMLVATEDEEEANPGGRSRMTEVLGAYHDADDRPGLAAAGSDVLHRAADPRSPQEMAADFFAFTVARALDGAEALIGGSGAGKAR